jgi:hypothetical protein
MSEESQQTESTTYDVAAQEVSAADPRGWEITEHNQIRRAYDAPSYTHGVARKMFDAAQAFGLNEDGSDMPHGFHLAENSAPVTISEFARDVNAADFAETLPENASADMIIDAIYQRYKARKQ